MLQSSHYSFWGSVHDHPIEEDKEKFPTSFSAYLVGLLHLDKDMLHFSWFDSPLKTIHISKWLIVWENVLNAEEEYQQEGRKQLSTTLAITLEDLHMMTWVSWHAFFLHWKMEIQPTYDKILSANGDNGIYFSSSFLDNESNKTLSNEGKSWRSLKVQQTNTPICDFEYGRNFGTHNYVHLQSAFPIKFEHNSARSDICFKDSHPTYDMDSDEE